MVYHIDDVQTIIPSHIRRRSFQPGKKTILLSVLLSIMLLLSQMFCTFNQKKPPKLALTFMHQRLESLNTLIELPPCLKNFLGSKKPSVKPPGTCHHITPPRGFCSLTQELFYEHPPETCLHQKEVNFCKVVNGTVTCVLPKECKESNIFVGAFNPEETLWTETPFEKLEEKIDSISELNNKGFVFIKCVDKTPKEMSADYATEYADPVQLLLLPKRATVSPSGKKGSDININMIMIDSLSQNHFYRSLPQTIYLLDKLKDGTRHTVVDFRFVQAVKQRTYESLQALFSGYVNTTEKPFGTYSSPYFPLPLDVLLNKYKKRGYRTLWLEDLCWQWEWGLAKDLKVFNKSLSREDLWKSFVIAIKTAGIDDVDLTLASCDILKANEANDPFHDVLSICFNGKFHHEYLLEYLQLYQDQMEKNQQPFFSFMQTNVAHEETGIRIQSLDKHLEKYLHFAQNLDDTITVFFSDHGSAYGTFLQASPEAYVETFNPFLIIIIPKKLEKTIDIIKLKILQDNSQHLVTLLDVHETLLDIIGEVNDNKDKEFKRKYLIRGGLFSNISPERSCRDLPLIQPNLCICNNFETTVYVSNYHYAYAEFGLGVINNMILEKRHRNGQKGFGNCQLLLVKKIRSVRELRRSADVIQYKIDAEVSGVMDSKLEYFFLIVEVGNTEPSIRLLSFERNSVYGTYKTCQDPNVDVKMCYCRKNVKPKRFNFLKFFSPEFLVSSLLSHDTSEEFAMKQIQVFHGETFPSSSSFIDKYFPADQPCLYIIRHQYDKVSFNIFGLNLCSSMHKVTLDFVTDNFYLSEKPKASYLLRQLDIKLLIGGTNANFNNRGSWDYNISVV